MYDKMCYEFISYFFSMKESNYSEWAFYKIPKKHNNSKLGIV